MKSFILAALASLTIAFAGVAGAGGMWDTNSTFPEGSVQISAE